MSAYLQQAMSHMSGMTPAEAAAHARRIIDTFMYLTIATADDDGRPWASPARFAPASPTEFFWASDPHARHSRNIATRADVALVIFDSTVPIGGAEAVYVEAMAEELRGVDLKQAVTIYSHRSQDVGAPEWTLADVTPPARLRLYRATASAIFVLDSGDRRIEVNLDALRERACLRSHSQKELARHANRVRHGHRT